MELFKNIVSEINQLKVELSDKVTQAARQNYILSSNRWLPIIILAPS